MASGRLVNGDWMPAVDANGYPLPDAFIRVYVNRTTTLATVYSDEALTLPQANPVPADSSGQFPYIWQDDALMFSMELGSVSRGTIATVDDIAPSSELGIINADLKQDNATILNFALAGANTDKDRWDKLPANIYEFSYLVTTSGGKPDWTAAAQAWLNSGRELRMPAVGKFRLTDKITMRADGNYIVGGGVTESVFFIDSGFNMSARCVLKIPKSASEKHAGFTNIGFEFEQPDTGRAGFIRYPWAVDMTDCSRCMIGNVRITGGWNGIKGGGNTGGLMAGRWEIGCAGTGFTLGSTVIQSFQGNGSQTAFTFTEVLEYTTDVVVSLRRTDGVTTSILTAGVGFNWNGLTGLTTTSPVPADRRLFVNYGNALDFIHFDKIHSWPFGFGTAARLAGYWDGATISGQLGRVDGLDISSYTNFAGKLNTGYDPLTNEGPFGCIGIFEFDSTYARLEHTAGRLSIATGYLSASGTDAETYVIKNRLYGVLTCGSMIINGAPLGTVPFIQNSSRLSITGGSVGNSSLTVPLIESTAGEISVVGLQFISGMDTVRLAANLKCSGGSATFVGCQFPRVGVGGGKQIEITTDDAHVVTANTLDAWDYVYPVAANLGAYGPNGGFNDRSRTVAAGTAVVLYNGDNGHTVFLTGCAGQTIGTWNVPTVGTQVRVSFDGAVTLPGDAPTFHAKGGNARVTVAKETITLVSNGTQLLELG